MNSPPAKSPSVVPPLARTPLYHWHERNGARIGEWDGWQVAEVFTDIEKELAAAKKGLAIADISAFPKINFLGAGIPDVTRNLTGDGRAGQPLGVDEATADPSVLVCRLKEDQLLVMALTTSRAGLEKLVATLDSAVVRHDMTSAYAGVWIVGPYTESSLGQLTHHDVGSMPAGSCAETGLAGVPAILIRPPKLAVSSLQVLVPWDVAEYVWETLFVSCRKSNISPIGMEALEELMQS
jgi:glycine cleavage system aminomethyltransferase T